MDNECAKDLKDGFYKEKVKFQLVPPHSHRANMDERVIQTFKDHFKTGLALVDPDFPIGE